MPAFICTEQIMIIVAKRTLKHMKETKLKRLIKKMMDCVFLDAMTPEFKAANAELLKAIKMNDKSGAIPHADLEAVNKAMKENDADKAGAALKKVQLQFSKAEKKLDDDVKSIQAKLETTKKTAETAKASLKQKKALASVFDKLKTLVAGLSNNPKSASKLTALTDKVKDYGDLSKRASQIITLVSSNKDASKQIDMLKKSVDAAEKKFKKDLANVEKESKKADDALEVAKMQAKITQGKKDAFTKERLYIANVVKQMPQGNLLVNQKYENVSNEKRESVYNEIENILIDWSKKTQEAFNEYQKIVSELKLNKKTKSDYFEIAERLGDARRKVYQKGKQSKEDDDLKNLCNKWMQEGNVKKLLKEIESYESNNPNLVPLLKRTKLYAKRVIKQQNNYNKAAKSFENKYSIPFDKMRYVSAKKDPLESALITSWKSLTPRLRALLKSIGEDPSDYFNFIRSTGRFPKAQ